VNSLPLTDEVFAEYPPSKTKLEYKGMTPRPDMRLSDKVNLIGG